MCAEYAITLVPVTRWLLTGRRLTVDWGRSVLCSVTLNEHRRCVERNRDHESPVATSQSVLDLPVPELRVDCRAGGRRDAVKVEAIPSGRSFPAD